VENPAAGGISPENLRQAFSQVFVGNYAPIHIASYMVDHELWGASPGGYATANVALHAANALLLFWLLLLVVKRRLVAFLAACLFALHPVQVESVAWISQRKTVLSMLFFLLSFLLFIAHRDGRRPALAYAGSLLCFVLAVLTKSATVILPVVLLLHDRLGSRRATWTRVLADKIPFVVVAGAAGLLAVWSQQPVSTSARLPYLGGNPAAWLFTMSTVMVRYLGLLFWPANLSAAYAPPFRASLDGPVAGSLLLLAMIGAGSLLLWRRRPEVFFWLAVGFLGLVPVLQIVPLVTLMNDRYLYFPLLGAAPLVVLLALPSPPPRWRAAPVLATALLLVASLALAVLSRERVSAWRDDLTLWADATRKTPESPAVWFSLGMSLDDAGREVEASLAYLRALALDLDMPVARSNLGQVRLWAAQDALASGALRSGDRAADLVALGTARLLLGHRRAAEDACAEALRLAPSRMAWVCIGNSRLEPGRALEARAAFSRAAAFPEPVDARLAYQQARAEALAGERDRALEYLRLALALGYKDFGTILRDPLLSDVRAMPGFRETYLQYVRHRRDRTALPEG